MLDSSDSSKEYSISSEQAVDVGNGSVIYSQLIGTHEIVGSGSNFVVIEKQRDVNLKTDEQDELDGNETCRWAIGAVGSSYSGNFYCIGGGATTNAKGTISSTGGITVGTNGAGYDGKPQVVVTGGGWRTATSPDARGDYEIGSSEGVLLFRGYSSGAKTFIESSNPNQ